MIIQDEASQPIKEIFCQKWLNRKMSMYIL